MKRNIFSCMLMLLAAAPITAQKEIQAEGNGEADYFDWDKVDSVRYGKENQYIDLNLSVDDIEKITFSLKDNVDLNKADQSVEGNKLERVYLTAESNEGIVLADVEGTKNGNSFSIFVPYLKNRNSLALSFSTKGKVYVQNALQKSGVTKQSFVKTVTYKVVSASGEVDTYTVDIYTSGLPVIKITTTDDEALSNNWSTLCPAEIWPNDKPQFTVDLSVKYKGGKYSQATKRSYSLKLDKKTELFGLSTGKRWTLQANNDDKTLLRNRMGQFMGSDWTDLAWTPSSQAVELIVNGKHMGSYVLSEDPRIAEDRVNSGILLEATDDVDESDPHFQAETSKITFKIVDPDNAKLSDAAKAINDFESALYGSNFKDASRGYRNLIDVNSFVEWYLINEICGNTEAAFESNCFLNITSDGKLAMGPIYNMEDYLGNNDASYEGFVLRKEGWFARLFEDPYFVGLVAEKFNEMKGKLSALETETDGMKAEIVASFIANEALWNANGLATSGGGEIEGALKRELSSIHQWLTRRVNWLATRFENDAKTAKDDKNGSNEITEFSLSKNSNGSALLSDYKATISGNNIDVFVPYLVEFNLEASIKTSNGATVYADGEEVKSGAKVNYLKTKQFKVVSSSGDVRTYNVNVHNSGIPVLYINTPNNKAITSKTEWIDRTDMIMYNVDGTVNYDAGSDKVQIKGRGNSTWDASSDKRPYAIKQNKEDEVLGMLEHKRWILLANYYDATFLRNEMANYLSKRYTTADWSPSGFNVELVLNGKHVGNYYFCEQAKINKNRVPGEYLVEADYKVKSTGGGGFMWGGGGGGGNAGYQFEGEKSKNVFNVKHPEVPDNSQELQYVKGKINDLENALYGNNWSKVKELIDLPSFADWYVIKELSKDYDGNMFTSCYCHIMKDGIIRMGPVWDFDLAFGGNPFETMFGGGGGMWGGGGGTDYAWYNKPEDYYIGAKEQATGTNWFLKFFAQKEFLALVKERIDWMVEDMDVIMAYIDQKGKENELSATANKVGYSASSGGGGMMWGGGGGGTNNVSIEDYQKSIDVMKKFIKERLLWIQKDLKSKGL
ncbi:MAG: CotH kinase family protein [Paludibacteraceae bacterium]|nr:CotH kinase family protein [Paludibacteraceae bacterium]